MTNKQEQSLKAKIAHSLGTKAQFVRIDSSEWEDPEHYIIRASYKGFWYLIRMRDGKIVEILREVG